jgi:hypothetical protein
LVVRDEVHRTGASYHGQKSSCIQATRTCRAQVDQSPQETGRVPADNDREPAPALVPRRDRAQRRAHPRGRCVHLQGSQAGCGLVEALGGTKQAPQGRSVSLRALHADLLHQSCRKESAGGAEEDFDAGQGRTAKAVREGCPPLAIDRDGGGYWMPASAGMTGRAAARLTAPCRPAFFIRPQSSSSGATWRGRQCRS